MPAFELTTPAVDWDIARDDLSITGLSGRLPESDNIQEFRDNLMNKVDMVTDDGRRWQPGQFSFFSVDSHLAKFNLQ